TFSRAFLASSSTTRTSPNPDCLRRSVNAVTAAITAEVIATRPPDTLIKDRPVMRLMANTTKDIQRDKRVRLNPVRSRADPAQRYRVIAAPTRNTTPMLTALTSAIVSVGAGTNMRFVKPKQA